MLAVLTNEDPTNLNQIMLKYLTGIVIGSNISPSTTSSNAFIYNIGDPGKYFVNGLLDDPANI